MDCIQNNQRRVVRRGLLVLGMLAVTMPATAQEPAANEGRMRVLIPALEPQDGANKKFGEKTAEELRDFIDDMQTHTPVDEKEMKATLRKYKVKQEELDCIKWRQLATLIGAELVMCGGYTGSEVSGRFINAKTGEVFEVPAFASAEPKAAAQQIHTRFEDFVNQVRLTSFCLQYFQSQQYDQALEACNKSLEVNDQSQAAIEAKISVLNAMERYPEALSLVKQLLELNPAHNNALLLGGIIAAKAGEQQLGRDYFVQYLELNPGDVNVRLKMASDLRDAGDAEGAMRLVEGGLQTDPDNPDLLTYAGHFAMIAGANVDRQGSSDNGAATVDPKQMYQTALGYYQRVHAAKGAETSIDVIKNMSVALGLLDQSAEAVRVARAASEAKPDDADLLVVYSDALRTAGEYTQAAQVLDRAASIKPDIEGLATKRAALQLSAGNVKEAAAAFRQAINSGSLKAEEVSNAIFHEGYQKMKADKNSAAIELFELSAEFATTPANKARANFFSGVIVFNRAAEAHKPQNLASAKASLPLFQRALTLFQASTDYTEQASAIRQYIDNARKYIEYEQALIKRG